MSTAFSATQVTLVFIANNASHKFDELENDNHVNVSFLDTSTTSWASYVSAYTSLRPLLTVIPGILVSPRSVATQRSSRSTGRRREFSSDTPRTLSNVCLSISAYFGDLKDGIHKGDESDPRVSIIEVIPEEVRFWVATKGTVTRAIDTAISAVTSGTSVPGELITLTKPEVCDFLESLCLCGVNLLCQIQLIQGLHTKQ